MARENVRRCKPVEPCYWSARLLEAEVLLNDNQPDAAGKVLAEEPPRLSQLAAQAARRIWLQGDLEVERSNSAQAEKLYSKARQMATSAAAWDVVSEVDLMRARLLVMSSHDTEGSVAVFRDVAEQSVRRGDSYYEAIALNGLGMIRLNDWRFDEAIPLFQRTIEAARRGNVQRLVVVASNNLMICNYRLGSFEDAVKSYKQAMQLLGNSGPATYRMHLLGQMGNTLLYQGKVREAIDYYRQAVSFARVDADAARYYRTLASAHTLIQDWDGAERSIAEALSHGSDAAFQSRIEKIQAAIAEGRGHYDEARLLYQKGILDANGNPEILWESHAALAGIYTKTGNYRQADEEFANTIRIIDSNVGRISTQEHSLTFFSLQIGFYHDYVRALIARQAYLRALDIADSSRARLLLQRLALRRAADPLPTNVEYVRLARRLNSVLLFYMVAPGQSYLWVITPQGIQPPIPLPPAEQLRQWVDQYRTFIEKRLGDPVATPNEAGRRLYDALIAPAEPFIPRDSRVILLPDDALNWLNFETLPVYGKSAGETPHYWIEDVRVEIAPSLTALSTDRAWRPSRPNSLLIIGDPLSPGREFPALDYAAKEIGTIQASLPAANTTKFTGATARPAVYRAAVPANFSLLHFSAHAVANKESPLDSAIILSPQGGEFKLYARDVIGIPLQADLVTISACRSAGARSYSGEGLVGFAWAFLQAGAHNVIAGLWDVTDSSTPEIMNVLYSNIARGESPANALRAAKLKLIHSGHGYRRPYYWGPFQIYTR